MEWYAHYVLYRNGQEMRALAAPHRHHLHEAVAARTAARRSRKLAWVRAVRAMLSRHSPAAPGPASAGGRLG